MLWYLQLHISKKSIFKVSTAIYNAYFRNSNYSKLQLFWGAYFRNMPIFEKVLIIAQVRYLVFLVLMRKSKLVNQLTLVHLYKCPNHTVFSWLQFFLYTLWPVFLDVYVCTNKIENDNDFCLISAALAKNLFFNFQLNLRHFHSQCNAQCHKEVVTHMTTFGYIKLNNSYLPYYL